MAGAAISVESRDLTRANARLQALARRGQDMTPMLDNIGASLVASTQQRFEREEGPDGKAWTPLSKATLLNRLGGKRKAFTKKGALRKPAARRLAGFKILQVSGLLRDSITHRASGTQVEVGTNKIYGGIHQRGGKAGRGRQVTIPARPYLGIDDSDDAEIGRIADDFIMEPFQ